jgi:hypothetical protein
MEQITLPATGKTVSIPSTGAEWELFTVSRGPCKRAANALTSGLKKALLVVDKAAKDGFRPTENGLEELVEKYVRPAMTKYADLGASDTEPRNHAYSALENAIKVLTGSR